MKEAEIRKYAALMGELGLTGIEINEHEGTVRLERQAESIEKSTVVRASATPAYAADAAANKDKSDNGDYSSVISPTVGIFYAAPSEKADAYVKVGDRVKKGTVLCIIEAMKLMNEVTAEEDGVIEAVLAENGQVVEYGTELFRIGRGAA